MRRMKRAARSLWEMGLRSLIRPGGSPCGDEPLELSTALGAAERETHEAERYAPAGDVEEGASTAEYGIVMLAAVGFAGLLVVILKSDEVRSMLMDIVRNALSIAGNTGLL